MRLSKSRERPPRPGRGVLMALLARSLMRLRKLCHRQGWSIWSPVLVFSAVVTITAVFCCFAHKLLFLYQQGQSGLSNAGNAQAPWCFFIFCCLPLHASMQHADMSVQVSPHLCSHLSFRYDWPCFYQGSNTILTLLVLLPSSSDSPTTVSPFDFGSILTRTNTQQK